MTKSERLFREFCTTNGLLCSRVAAGVARTPDFVVQLVGVQVACEVKEITPTAEDLAPPQPAHVEGVGRLLRNRLRGKLKDVSAQLKAASLSGLPTLLIVCDLTPMRSYTEHPDVLEAMLGRDTVRVVAAKGQSGIPYVSAPFFGGDRGMGPSHNTSVSALAILDSEPLPMGLRIYHNPYAAVRLDLELWAVLPVVQFGAKAALR